MKYDPDPPIQPKLIGVDIKSPPAVKVLLAKSDFTEIEKLLNSGWKMGSSFNHPEGVLLILVKA